MLPASLPILKYVLLVLSLIIVCRAQSVGDACTVGGGPGVCKPLPQCLSVYNALLAGTPPEEVCGFASFEPIVCCPRTVAARPSTKPATQRPATTSRPITSGPVTAGPFSNSIDRRWVTRDKCAEYAKAVYGLELPPTLGGFRAPVNVSRCAIKQQKLITGGEKADPKEFPHMAAVGYNTNNGINWSCGGTLISDKFVMTAAHCTYSMDWGNAAWVRLGDLNLARTDDDARPIDIAISERINHPRYKKPSQYHDIALLRLERSVEFSAYIRPACLPYTAPDTGKATKAIASGWGREDWSDIKGTDDLFKVTLNLVNNRNCNDTFIDGQDDRLHLGIVDDWQVCAGEVGKDTCQGDSGGPLSIFNEDQTCMYSVIGVTSLGRLCGNIIPGVYTRVYYYVPWIQSVAWPEDVF